MSSVGISDPLAPQIDELGCTPSTLWSVLQDALWTAEIAPERIAAFSQLAEPILADSAVYADTTECPSDTGAKRRAYDAICDRIETFADHHSIRIHKELVLTLQIGMPYHRKFLLGLGVLMDEIGGIKYFECRQLVPIPDGGWSSFKSDVARACGMEPGLLSGVASADRMVLEDLLARLPFDASSLVGTCLDPVRGHEFDEPEPEWCARAGAMTSFRDLATLGIVFLPAEGCKHYQVVDFLCALLRADVLAAIHGESFEGSPCLLSALCDAYVRQASHGGLRDSDRTRADTVACLKRSIGKMRNFMLSKTLDPIRPDLEKIVPAAIELSEDGAEIYGSLCSDTQKAGHLNRKEKTNKETLTLNERFESTRSRCEVVRQIGDRIRAIAEIALTTGEIQDCPVAVKTLDDLGRPTDHKQVEIFRVWPMTVACRTFGKEVKTYGANAPIAERYIVQHVGTEPFGLGEANETWAVTIGKARVYSMVGSQPVAVQEVRHETIRRFGLSGGKPSHAGLLKFNGTKSDLAGKAAARGVTFIAMEELEAAIRFAGLACEIAEQTRARYESMVQLLPKGFVRDDKGAALPRHSQKVKPKHVKGGNPASIPPLELNISEAAFMEFVSLAQLHKRASGVETLPTIRGPRWIGWKLRDAAYGFAWTGHIIDHLHMGFCLDLLQAGWRRLTVQDLRNCLSEEAFLDGESLFVTMQALGHSLEKDSEAYRSILGDWLPDKTEGDG